MILFFGLKLFSQAWVLGALNLKQGERNGGFGPSYWAEPVLGVENHTA